MSLPLLDRMMSESKIDQNSDRSCSCHAEIPKTAGRFPADMGSSGSPTNGSEARTSAGSHVGIPSDDGVPPVPLKSRYL